MIPKRYKLRRANGVNRLRNEMGKYVLELGIESERNGIGNSELNRRSRRRRFEREREREAEKN